MADVIHIEHGHSPWQPSEDAELVKQYQYYEIPLSGVILQHGTRYFFACLAGAEDDVSFWFYAGLRPEEEQLLDQSTLQTFRDVVDFEGASTLALAVEGAGLVASHVMSDVTTKELDEAHDALVNRLRSWTTEASEVHLTTA